MIKPSRDQSNAQWVILLFVWVLIITAAYSRWNAYLLRREHRTSSRLAREATSASRSMTRLWRLMFPYW